MLKFIKIVHVSSRGQEKSKGAIYISMTHAALLNQATSAKAETNNFTIFPFFIIFFYLLDSF